MEKYKKPIMKVIELEKVDVLTESGNGICKYCGGKIYTPESHGNGEEQCRPGLELS